MQTANHTHKRRHVLLALGWYNHLINRGVARYARQANWTVHTGAVHDGVLPDDWQGDGIITLLDRTHHPELRRFVLSAKVPVVDLACSYFRKKLPRVLEDHAEIGRVAARHLMDRGFEHLAYYESLNTWPSTDRKAAFCEMVRQEGRKVWKLRWPDVGRKDKSRVPQRDWLAERLARLPKPLGIMAVNDDHAITVLHACQHAGISVPEQVAVIGVDNDELARELAPVPLTSVMTDPVDQGYRAAMLLDQLMLGEPVPEEPIRLAPSGIAIRQSTDTWAVSDQRVASALGFIRENFHRPISVQDVADEIIMSRRRLHDAFVKNVGHSIACEITRRRIEYAQSLLQTTDKKAKEIARLSGFTSAEHMSKVFTRVAGQSPRAYRKRSARG